MANDVEERPGKTYAEALLTDAAKLLEEYARDHGNDKAAETALRLRGVLRRMERAQNRVNSMIGYEYHDAPEEAQDPQPKSANRRKK